jgi:hypothetical protein
VPQRSTKGTKEKAQEIFQRQEQTSGAAKLDHLHLLSAGAPVFLLLFLAVTGKMASRQKERALTSPKTSALAFISVLPWRINDRQDTNCQMPEVGCS